jgi:AP-3 complex subunit beta
MHGDRILPDWLEQGAEPSLRNSPDDAPKRAVPTSFGSSTPRSIVSHATSVVLTPGGGSSAPNSAKGTFTDLDKFYDDDEEEEEEEDDDEEEEEEDGSEDVSEPDSSSGSDEGGSHPEHERDGHA